MTVYCPSNRGQGNENVLRVTVMIFGLHESELRFCAGWPGTTNLPAASGSIPHANLSIQSLTVIALYWLDL